MDLKAGDEGKLPWYTLDARKSIEELHEEIKAIAIATIAEVKEKEIGQLWKK